MELLVAKVVALLSLFVSTVIFGVVPYKFVSGKTEVRLRWVSLASCFAGGVFLGTCFLHLLPDVRESFEAVFRLYHIQSSYPVTEFTVLFGFFLVLIFEQIVLLYHQPGQSSACKTANVPPHGCHKTNICLTCDDEDGQRHLPRPNAENGALDDGRVRVALDDSMTNRSTTKSGRANENESEAVLKSNVGPSTPTRSVHAQHHESERQPLLTSNSYKDETGPQPSASLRSLLLLAALSLHSLFEGLAMGLQGTTSSVFEVFTAVLLHKCILAFSLGVRFVNSGSKLAGLLLAVLVFAVMSPIGVSVGIAVTETGNNNTASRQLATAILQGIATGTFLFVTFLEILAHELKERRAAAKTEQMLKLLMALLGCAAMAGVQFLDS